MLFIRHDYFSNYLLNNFIMKKNGQSPTQMTRHHIYPTSRKKIGIVSVCRVERLQHELYHHLFGNMNPEEILEHLNKTFWNDMFDIDIYLKE